jgi:molybdopterin/thiamine biosynthesis adenylyltransferase
MVDNGTPEAGQFWPEFAASSAAVGSALADRNAVTLSDAELKVYASRSAALGWRLTVLFENGDVRRMDVIVDGAFPYTSARVALVDRPPFLTWPHIEEDGILCIPSDDAGADDPLAAVSGALSEAVALIENSMAGATTVDFDHEFYSYWNRRTDDVRLYSILRLEPPLRLIRVAVRPGLHVVGDDDASVVEWLRNYMCRQSEQIATDGALFIWLDAPPRPKDYPSDVAGALRLIRTVPDAEDQVFELLASQQSRLTVVFGFATSNGNAAAAVRLPARPAKIPGFRPSTVPADVVKAKYDRRAAVIRQRIERVDSLWIHGRDGDSAQTELQRSTVVAVGCGSLGAPTIRLLVASGVGEIIVIDHDLVEPANLSRHVLGAHDIGLPKATALAKKLLGEFPHATVKSKAARLEELLVSDRSTLVTADVVFSATASWHTELMLNKWHIRSNRTSAVVYAWLEPYAVVGHVVVIGPRGGCLRCGYDKQNREFFRLTEWDSETERREPACGAVFQPYGAVDANNTCNLAAQVVLRALLRPPEASSHHIWSCSTERLDELEGRWTPAAIELFRDNAPVSGVHERQWMRRRDCAACGEAQ